MTANPGQRAGFVAIVGAPNVGKSTLLNRLVGAKVSIVSPKVQTTRTRVLGICIEGPAQIIFIDTPGIFQPRRRLDRAMVAAAWIGTADADEVLLLVDASRGLDRNTAAIVKKLKRAERTVILAINKVDLVNKPDLLALAAELNEAGAFTDTFMISAETGDGVADLMALLAGRVAAGRWLFPEDQISDMPGRLTAAEITREQLYLQLHKELPYAAAVETESWKDQDDGSLRIEQVVYVERGSQKAIVLGKKGSRVKSIGEAARKELEEIFGRRVHLFLFVKVRGNWGDDPERYRDLGLDFDA
ncbi:MAG TPA: GTPase Era [Rhodospirillales bacterium]|jgi:GTP-binding protein Era|nr:GTPase Era [Rhodospirillales bacterium]MEE3050476.1 GTPase Era [Pseudomonadota bacterium]HIM42459.1 GTPase Era [Rhodospirillales bacterium]